MYHTHPDRKRFTRSSSRDRGQSALVSGARNGSFPIALYLRWFATNPPVIPRHIAGASRWSEEERKGPVDWVTTGGIQ